MSYGQTFNPCDECDYSYSKNNQETGMCEICEFKKTLKHIDERIWVLQRKLEIASRRKEDCACLRSWVL